VQLGLEGTTHSVASLSDFSNRKVCRFESPCPAGKFVDQSARSPDHQLGANFFDQSKPSCHPLCKVYPGQVRVPLQLRTWCTGGGDYRNNPTQFSHERQGMPFSSFVRAVFRPHRSRVHFHKAVSFCAGGVLPPNEGPSMFCSFLFRRTSGHCRTQLRILFANQVEGGAQRTRLSLGIRYMQKGVMADRF